MAFDSRPLIADAAISCRAAAEGYIGKVCFKTGPPERVGVELEWTVHHRADPGLPLDVRALASALGRHAPPTLDPASAHHPLPGRSLVTLEPGGQVELSSPPVTSLARLIDDMTADIARLSRLLDSSGLRLGGRARDPRGSAQRLIHTQRYEAMERAFDRVGPWGRAMMRGTAGLQVCLDIGANGRAEARWHAAHVLGPPLIALFANSPGDGWASERMRVWYETDPVRTLPPVLDGDPVGAWARRVLETPLLCLRRPSGGWDPPVGRLGASPAEHSGRPGASPAEHSGRLGASPAEHSGRLGASPAEHSGRLGASPAEHSGRLGASPAEHSGVMGKALAGVTGKAPAALTFGEWVDGALPTPPTFDDLDYHLTTMFPPVRPRGYLEVRYLDAQPGGDWVLPLAMLTSLFAREETVDAAAAIAEPAAERWVQAARDGLADPVIAAVVPRLVELACAALDDTDLPTDTKADIARGLSTREGLK